MKRNSKISGQITNWFSGAFVLVLILAVMPSANAQTWERNYGELTEAEYTLGKDVVETSDGNFLVLGEESIGTDPLYAHLWKINQSGDTLWTKAFPGVLNALFLHALPNGYVVVTQSELLYLDHNGDIEQRKTITVPGIRIRQYTVSGEGFVFLGNIYPTYSNVLVRTTAAGDTLWTRRYDQPHPNPFFHKVHEKSSGNLMLSGAGFKLGFGPTFLMWTLDKNGSIILKKEYAVSDVAPESDVAETPDGGYMILCQRFPSALMKIDAAGDSIWTRTFVNAGSPGRIRRVSDGYIVQRGSHNPVGTAFYIILNKVGFDGAVLWERTVLYREMDKSINSFKITSDGDLLMTGWYGELIGKSLSSMYLLKTNSEGIYERAIGWEKPNNESFDHRVIVSALVRSNIEGDVLEKGDYVGAYFKDENGNLKMNASIRWEGVADTLNLTQNSGGAVKDGFDAGETILLRVRKPHENRGYDVDAFFNLKAPYTNGKFVKNGISNILGLKTPTVCQQLELHAGWNLASIFVNPRNTRMNSIFRSHRNVIVKDASGKVVFAPDYGVLTGVWNILEGYMIYSATNQVVGICGDEIDPWQTKVPLLKKPYPVFLPYFANFEVTNYNMFRSLGDSFLYVQSFEYRDGATSPAIYTFLPNQFPQWNGIRSLQPGHAYRVMLTDDVPAFSFPSGLDQKLGGRSAVTSQDAPLQHFVSTPSVLNNNAVLALTHSAMKDMLEPGDEVAIFDDAQQIVGANVYAGSNVVISLFETPRLSANKNYSVVVYKKSTNSVHSCDVHYSRGDEKFYPNTLSIIDKMAIGQALTEEQALTIFPNPVQTEFSIRFTHSGPGVVVFSLLDSTGKKRKTLLDEPLDKGVHYKQFNVSELPDGLYVYQLVHDHKVLTGKIIVNKK